MKKDLPYSSVMDIRAAEDHFEQVSFDCGSSMDGLSSSEALSLSLRSDEPGGNPPLDEEENEDSSSLEEEEEEEEERWSSSSLNIKHNKKKKGFFFQGTNLPAPSPPPSLSKTISQTRNKSELSEVEMMKEKFSKLLLGEDMSGGGKGVCSALAISNAIINLSASVFGELWRLEPLSLEKKTMWRREMNWLLSVADHIVELVPSRHSLPNGGNVEVMVTRPRSDIHVNLPALRKLDGMLLETLDTFNGTEFWYVDQGLVVADENNHNRQRALPHRRDDKWWLPIPKVPNEGLSKDCTKQLQHQRECINQILKAAVAINTQILSEMEIPELYFDALPKNGKASLGEDIYRYLTSESFHPDAILDMIDLSNEHRAVDIANRIEAAIHVWRRRRHQKLSRESKQQNTRSSWGLVKDFVLDIDRRDYFAGRAENLLLCLKQRFPNLRQTLLDINKIQHNKDVGRAILESYSRVLESLAFNIASRIEDVLYAGDMVKQSPPPCSPPHAFLKSRILSTRRRGYPLNLVVHTPYGTPLVTPSASPTPSSSPRRTPNSPLHSEDESSQQMSFPDMGYAYEFKSVGRVIEVGTTIGLVKKDRSLALLSDVEI